MIGYIKGTVEAIFDDSIIVDNQGIGYRIFTSGNVISDISRLHTEVKIYTYMNVREDGISLFGFLTQEELDTFKLLISVNGVGPKVAISILSTLTVKDLSLAVMMGDAKAISRANGVGAKGANRIIMELKDKLHYEDILDVSDDNNDTMIGASDSSANSNNVSDTVLALVSLGYSEFDAMKAIKQVPGADAMTSDKLLKEALKKIF